MANQKVFGVWMDNHHATIVGLESADSNEMIVIGHVKGEETPANSSENASNNHEKTLQAKFFKEITSHMQNADKVHVTGTGTAQEQFIHYLTETPQFKDTKTEESTSNKMSDEKLIEYFSKN